MQALLKLKFVGENIVNNTVDCLLLVTRDRLPKYGLLSLPLSARIEVRGITYVSKYFGSVILSIAI